MNFEPSWAFDKMAFDFPMDPFGTLEVEGGFKGENLFGKCEGKCYILLIQTHNYVIVIDDVIVVTDESFATSKMINCNCYP